MHPKTIKRISDEALVYLSGKPKLPEVNQLVLPEVNQISAFGERTFIDKTNEQLASCVPPSYSGSYYF